MENFYLLNTNLHFTLAICKKSLVGNRSLHPEVEHAWNMDLTHKFRDWNCDRFWVVTKGSAHILTTFGEFDIHEGHAYYIPASTIIKTHCDDFMEQYFVNFITMSKLPLTSLYNFHYESEQYDLAFKLITDIIDKNTTPGNVADIFINSAMTMLLSLFIKDIKKDDLSALLPAIKYIEKHLSEKISIKELAQLSGFTPEYFSVLFKKVFQLSPQQYISSKRIDLAKHLLISTSLSVAEIALACGYTDALYFSRIFSKQTLFSPTAFRAIREKNNRLNN